jgi:hypothetical protein
MDAAGNTRDRTPAWAVLGTFLGALGFGVCLAILSSGMRAIMATGTGFVAVGGPYEIAHPAPDWVWVIPVSVLAGWAFGGLFSLSAWRLDRFRVAPLIWASLFLLLGLNFLQYGIDPEAGIVWGWFVSGVVFVIMGAVPLFGPLLGPVWRRRLERKYGEYAFEGLQQPEHRLAPGPRRLVMLGIAGCLALGLFGGWQLFERVTG